MEIKTKELIKPQVVLENTSKIYKTLEKLSKKNTQINKLVIERKLLQQVQCN